MHKYKLWNSSETGTVILDTGLVARLGLTPPTANGQSTPSPSHLPTVSLWSVYSLQLSWLEFARVVNNTGLAKIINSLGSSGVGTSDLSTD